MDDVGKNLHSLSKETLMRDHPMTTTTYALFTQKGNSYALC